MSVQPKRTSARRKARELAKHLRGERPDYAYLKEVFRYLRAELEVEVPGPSRRLPWVPNEEQVGALYEAVWRTRRTADLVLIKTFLYTGVRYLQSSGTSTSQLRSEIPEDLFEVGIIRALPAQMFGEFTRFATG